MEGSGIADATWAAEAGYVVVGGISDYCDGNKNDVKDCEEIRSAPRALECDGLSVCYLDGARLPMPY